MSDVCVCHNSLSSCAILNTLQIVDLFHLEPYCPKGSTKQKHIRKCILMPGRWH